MVYILLKQNIIIF